MRPHDPIDQGLMRGRGLAPSPSPREAPQKRPALVRCPLDVLDEVLAKRTVIGDAERTAVVLWIAHSYIYDRGFIYTPRLLVTSLNPSCGKSALMRLIAEFSDGGIKLEKGTSLAAIRDLKREKQRVTLCLDQLDGIGRFDSEDQKLLNLLCSSAEIGAKVGMKEKVISKKKESFETVYSNVGFPTALGKIGKLSGDAIMSRCIVIRMQPETAQERAWQMPERMKPLPVGLLDRLREWLSDLRAEYIQAPKGTPSRTEDIWQPLLNVAKLAGGKWLERAMSALGELDETADRPETKEVKLLRRVFAAAHKSKGDYVLTAELDRILGVREDGDITPTQRGMWLTALGLKSYKRVWVKGSGKQVPGYLLADIRQCAERHRVSDLSDLGAAA